MKKYKYLEKILKLLEKHKDNTLLLQAIYIYFNKTIETTNLDLYFHLSLQVIKNIKVYPTYVLDDVIFILELPI